MTDAYLRQSALAPLGLAAHVAAEVDVEAAGVILCERPMRGQIGLRGDASRKAFREAVSGVLGFDLPRKATTATGGGPHAALWLGPDEWLVVTSSVAETVTAERLAAALDGQHAQVVTMGDARAVIGLTGTRVRDVLMKGCTLDLHPREFGPGRCTRTVLARAQILLHQLADTPEYDAYVHRSFAEYLWTWLEDAGTEYGVAVVVS